MSLRAAVPAVLIAAACGSASTRAPAEPVYARMPVATAVTRPGDTRTFRVKYVAHVTEVPAGTKTLRLWLPVPQNTSVQTITDLTFEGGTPSFGLEKKYGNSVAYFEVAD